MRRAAGGLAGPPGHKLPMAAWSSPQQLPDSRGFPGEVISLRHAGRGTRGLSIKFRRALEVSSALTQVRRDRGVPRELRIHARQRLEARPWPLRLSDRDRAV